MQFINNLAQVLLLLSAHTREQITTYEDIKNFID